MPFIKVRADVEELPQCSHLPSKPGTKGFRASRSAFVNLTSSSALGFVKEYFHSQRRKSLPTAASFPGFLPGRDGLSFRDFFRASGSAIFLKRKRIATLAPSRLRSNPIQAM